MERFGVGLGAGSLADHVVLRAPALAEVQDLAVLILQEPWDIRRPADLARRAQVTLGLLRQRCHGIGARHMAHLITQVRCVAFEYLIEVERLSRARARIICGTNDEAIFRKQVARVRYLLRPIGTDG